MSEKAILHDPTIPSARNISLLKAGSAIVIDITTPAGQKKKFSTTYIGYFPKKYVLIEYPDSSKLGNFAQFIGQGTGITVRGLIEGQDGAAVGFMTSIKQTLQIPSRIMVLDMPTAVSVQKLRSAVRIDTQIVAKVQIDKVYWQTTMANLSVNGGQLDIVNGEKLVLTENKVVQIIVERSAGEGNIKLNATVCNIKQQVDGVSFGVKFNDVKEADIIQLLYEAMV